MDPHPDIPDAAAKGLVIGVEPIGFAPGTTASVGQAMPSIEPIIPVDSGCVSKDAYPFQGGTSGSNPPRSGGESAAKPDLRE